ncbi:MAG: PIN domain-containing protein [Pseudomonadota bacterium]
MTLYLLDENVLKELSPTGHKNVRAWFAGVDPAVLRVSAATLFEKRRGWERRKKIDPVLAAAKLAELDALKSAYGSRLVPIDAPVAVEWARLLGAKDKNQIDRALAATARVKGFVLVTRNIADVRGCNVQVLDPFVKSPKIETV